MIRLFLTTFLLSLYSAVSSTSEYSKISEGWHPSSSLGSSAIRGGRDRRTSHWESRSHSNLDDDRRGVDDDKDRGHSKIPYPLLVQQPSPLEFSASQVELTGKKTNEIDFFDEKSFDNDSRLDSCINVIQKPVLLVSIAGARRSPDDMTNVQLNPTNSGRFGTIRCRRRIHGWRLQEPVYVEEPTWIFIDVNRQMGSVGHSMNDDDPFYVARGKRSLQMFDVIERARSKTNTDHTDNLTPEENLLPEIQEKNVQTIYRNKKSNGLGDPIRSSLLTNQELDFARSPTLGVGGGKSHTNGYVSPRNKHGDIMDILNEPFFISRGKKDSMNLRRIEWYNKYARKQMLDENFLPIPVNRARATNFGNCDPNKEYCFLESIARRRQMDSRFLNDPFAFRDRRGIMEDLLKEGDPFYLARGRRSSSSRVTKNSIDDSRVRQADLRFVNDPFAFRDRRGIMEDLLKEGDPFYLARGRRSSSSSVTKNSIDDSSQLTDSLNFELENDRPTTTTSRLQLSTENVNENLSILH